MEQQKTLVLPWLLVATPQLSDPNFKQKVVLVVEHGSHGSMGFVINRPTKTPLVDLVTSRHAKIPPYLPAWYGGPVDRENGIILHHRPASAGVGLIQERRSAQIAGYALSSSEETLVEMLIDAEQRHKALEEAEAQGQAGLPEGELLYPYRFLVGYSGWGPRQLEEELRQGAWIQTPATFELVFNTPWAKLWQEAYSLVGVNPRILAPSVQQYLN